MKNMVLYATLIEAISKMNDVQISTMLGYASDVLGVKSKTNSKAKPKEYSCEDYEVKCMKATKNVVTFAEYIDKRDVWKVLDRRFTSMGGTYDKSTQSVKFKNAKDAKAFAENTVVTAAERQSIRNEWAKR